MTMQQPKVSVITVNYNGKAHLEVFLPSLYEQEFPESDLEVILVDNGSDDGSVEFVAGAFPSVRVIRNEANLGFAKANNQAAAMANGRYLALLNNDMRLAPGWLTRMVTYLEKAPPDVVCAGARILNWDGSHVDFIDSGLAFNGFGLQLHFHAPADSNIARTFPQELLFACGGAMMVEKEVFLSTSGFDEDFFAYCEDVDFGWRLWLLGYRVGFCPDAVAYHRHNGTSHRFGLHKKLVLMERNALYAVLKNYGDDALSKVLPAALLLAVKRIAVRSGIDREDFRFAVNSSPEAPDVPILTVSPLRRFVTLLREEGISSIVRRILLKVASLVQKRLGPPAPPPQADGRRLIWSEAYASVVALEDLMDHLPRLMKKRQHIQSARQRSDAELFPLFKTPFQLSEGLADYPAIHHLVLEAMGVVAFFEEQLLSQASSLHDTDVPR